MSQHPETSSNATKAVEMEACNQLGCTALLMAAMHGTRKCVKLLLDAGAEVSRVDEQGKNVLSYLSAPVTRSDGSLLPLPSSGTVKVYWEGITLAVRRGADIRNPSGLGSSLMLLAARQGECDAVLALAEAKADVNYMESSLGASALLLAASTVLFLFPDSWLLTLPLSLITEFMHFSFLTFSFFECMCGVYMNV